MPVKRTVIFSIVILLLAGLAAGANRIAGGILDAQLPPLLTRVLGLPVTLAPMQANLLQLKASSARLVMGQADNPSVTATDIVVTISLTALLKREIRLEFASADDLMVNPSLWPSSGNPLPEDYLFLDPWLPDDLQFESGRYVFEDGTSYPLQTLRWLRKAAGGVSARWSESRGDGTLALSAELKSLQDLLQLAPLDIAWTAAVDGQADSTISLNTTVQPSQDAAYKILADIEATGINAHITATGAAPWTLPDQSQTTVKQLLPKPLIALFSSYSKSSKDQDTATLLESRLPRLRLPHHRGDVTIDEMRLGKEIGKDTTFKFSSSADGLQIKALRSKGPTGILDGELGIDSSAQGWTVKVDATMSGREDSKGIAEQFVDSSWLWRAGRAQLDGTGDTWGSLLNSLAGAVSLLGHHRGEVHTPISIEAQLDSTPGRFALEHMSIKLAEGEFTGSAALSGTSRHKLSMELQGNNLDVNFLFEKGESAALPGIAIPEYLSALPTLDLEIALDVSNLDAPSLQLATAQAKLDRHEQGGKLVLQATGQHAGNLDLELTAESPGEQPQRIRLRADFSELDLPTMFQQPVVLHSRSSGNIAFQSEGAGLQALFEAMQGNAAMDIEFRPDNDWQRASDEKEQLKFSGNSRFVIENDRIIGIEIDDLDIDSIEQDITGSVSVVAGRAPWLIADIKAPTLNVAALMALLPKSTEDADQANLLTTLKRLGAAKLTVDVDSLTISDTPLSKMQLKVISAKDVFGIKQLDFTTFGSRFESAGNISWQGTSAKFESSATLENVDLDRFLISVPKEQRVPVSGTVQLSSEGTTVAELLGNLNGHIDLKESQPSASGSSKSRRTLSMVARRLPDGVQADISSVEWGASELAGSITYHRTTPASLDIELQSGNLSLLPWETAYKEDKPTKEAKGKESGIGSAARVSAGFVGRALLTPVRLLTGPGEPEPGERMFSDSPLPLDALHNINVTVKGQMDELESTVLSAKGLSFNGTVKGGALNLTASSSQFGDGSADLVLTLDSLSVPPALKLETHFRDINKFSGKETYTQSGFISIESQGASPAELAANADGLAYIELGPGTFSLGGFAIFTADLGSTVFRTLIPGIEDRTPSLDCGVAVALLQDGSGITPYGFAMRTDQANLLGRIEVDLKTEKLQMRLESRSREGVGLSVGNVFSNAIRIRGTLTDPTVVPATAAIAWRGWAAFMTAGLSVVGESVLKRVLASDDPCKSTKKLIKKELCPKNALAASSPMVCPTG